ncbi:MAG: hypothetical protein ACYCQJ_13085 [Nitrososphaerales archaeon]
MDASKYTPYTISVLYPRTRPSSLLLSNKSEVVLLFEQYRSLCTELGVTALEYRQFPKERVRSYPIMGEYLFELIIPLRKLKCKLIEIKMDIDELLKSYPAEKDNYNDILERQKIENISATEIVAELVIYRNKLKKRFRCEEQQRKKNALDDSLDIEATFGKRKG